MKIQKYTYGTFETKKSLMCIRFGDHKDFPYCLSDFLEDMYPYTSALSCAQYITEIDILLGLWDTSAVLEKETNLVYIADISGSYYWDKISHLTNEMVLEFCKKGDIEFDILSFDNFKYLFRRWQNLLESEPKFALLYQNESDWYDVMQFQTKELMMQFIDNHLQAHVSDENSMYIKKHSYYQFNERKLVSFLNLECKDSPTQIPLCLGYLLEDLYPYERGLAIKQYISEFNLFLNIGKLLYHDVILEDETRLVYVVQGFEYHLQRRFEPKITKEEVLELCKEGKLKFDIITFENFKYLIQAWLELVQNHVKYSLLYQDECGWYDIVQFPTNELMKQFVRNHFQV
ncbi:hypothetical protein KBC04_03100 [Candidatus Babeliales bacterium]|nr:hypothetical protein [Candidatus Babeliales bacterium]MBP9843962.1 hypothetical protein [Candidatus Babeliales bacterium]